MKIILVFKNGELFKQLVYKTKFEAKMQFKFFKKYGMLDPQDCLKIEGLTFELI